MYLHLKSLTPQYVQRTTNKNPTLIQYYRQAEESVDCRMDHYQTSSEVHVSVFAKKVDQERSTIKFDETQVSSLQARENRLQP
jgi:regulation of enolase protein 1 (concanavalin A-like superfamily)